MSDKLVVIEAVNLFDTLVVSQCHTVTGSGNVVNSKMEFLLDM